MDKEDCHTPDNAISSGGNTQVPSVGKDISWLQEVPLSNSRRTFSALNIYLLKASNDFQEKTLAFKERIPEFRGGKVT